MNGLYWGYTGIAWWIWVLLIGLNVGLAFIPANMAKKKGYSYGGFWCLSFFASFLVAIIVAACLNPRAGSPAAYQQPYQQTSYQQPPYDPYQQPQYQPPPPPYTGGPPPMGYCYRCGYEKKSGDAFCSRCGAKL